MSMHETGKMDETGIESATKPKQTEMAPIGGKSFSRRKFLQLSGGVTAAALLPALAFGSEKASACSCPIPTSPRFSLSGSGGELFREVPLGSVTVLQSFGFDSGNSALYTIQLTYGSPATAGDLTVTKLGLSGSIQGQMQLKGFGHGVSIGVEPSGSSAYLWTETDGVSDGTNSWGTKICRFPFANGTTLYNTDASLAKYTVPGTNSSYTCSIDHYHGNLIVRYRGTGGTPRFDVYNLESFKAGNRNPIATVYQPSTLGVFQGYCAYGSYLYLLDGTAYGTSNPSPGNTYLTTVDINTGTQVDRFLTQAGGSLTYREPEGLAVHLTDPSSESTGRLCFGFASGSAGGRKATIFFKNSFIPS
ncbi:twin-arginine translocation signal domain-containing protein [Paenibacillus hodogayensis]|uniref:Twin-arginine translocation signal domain-containing protein n=1 Tax=Paenibacillus hodogayensis TaxID=279208 RepID=A0ABV5W455_9BACL